MAYEIDVATSEDNITHLWNRLRDNECDELGNICSIERIIFF